ncbi:MAG: hypothetical protein EBV01_12340 [Betaproteobacteria bacterium]|nr:hypothetical protein [Betaproteobacteria bacterium]HAB46761.1 hypothetical protein [Lautropia sp.]NBQ79406.1 hypothetical protein [Betaproteobacteria bacterium]NBS39981.1 hypothetical protein [Betaproteobacteria bacterium]NCV14430.1 hypothetical protein [Betaproteobacteria bacterium]
MIGSICALLLGARYEKQFRTILQEGFQARVELGDLASSIQELRRSLETPRVFDPAYVSGIAERAQEVERKAKSQSALGRVQELALPVKELGSLTSMGQGLERLSVNAALVERALNFKLAQKAPESVEWPAIKRFGSILEEYGAAVSMLRNSRSAANAIPDMRAASVAMAEQLPLALADSRRKGAPQVWRELLGLLPAERNEMVDRLLTDGRLLEDFEVQRNRAINRLEQVSARVDASERLLLQSKTGSEFSLVSILLSWLGIGLAVGSALLAARQGYLHGQSKGDHPVVEKPDAVFDEEKSGVENRAMRSDSEKPAVVESMIAARVTEALSLQDASSKLDLTIMSDGTEAEIVNDEVTSGYWIAAGSMAERRVALLDRQAEQLEGRVGSVMAASETLSSRIDLVVQSLQLLSDRDAGDSIAATVSVRERLEALQVIGMNLSLRVSTGEGGEEFFGVLEQFNDELSALSTEVDAIGRHDLVPTTQGRRLVNTLDEGRRLQAASDALRERTQSLLEDAQRFRRQSEALIRGIQEGAVSQVPVTLIKGKFSS